MSSDLINRELTQDEISKMVKRAVMDEYLYCPYCGYGDIEPDYDKCPDCHRANQMKERGLI
ncbi:MAG: hypothetical protein GF383_08620 [Candidatus Lokiarchaeota archaeon]|nr:hypothetical protein [Candidatus Lokiarchaeota archaeon]